MDNRTEQAPPCLPPARFFRPVATVSPTFIDTHDPLCLHCGAAWGSTIIDDEQVRHDVAGAYIDCPACTARYRPQGGHFIAHGAYRPERYCGHCQAWRPTGPASHDSIGTCIACGRVFDHRIDPPEQALMEALRAATTAEGVQTERGDN